MGVIVPTVGVMALRSAQIPDRASSAGRDMTLLLLCLAQFLLVVDGSVMFMALPTVAVRLDLAPATLSWVTNVYGLTFGGFLLVGGRLSDAYGPVRVFRASVAVFGVASLAGGVAASASGLLATRLIQGVAAALAPAILAILVQTYPDGAGRARALAYWGVAAAAGAPAGSIFGGVLTGLFGWTAVLFLNVPICLAILVGLRVAGSVSIGSSSPRSIEVLGALLATGGAAMLLLATVEATQWGPGRLVALTSGGISCLAVFGFQQRTRRDPLLPRRIWRAKSLRIGAAMSAAIGLSCFGLGFGLTLFLQQIAGMSPAIAGLALLPSGLAAMVSSRLAPVAFERLGIAGTTATGAVAIMLGLVWLARAGSHPAYVLDIGAPTALFGAGIGLALVGMQLIGMAEVAPGEAGLVGSLLTAAQQVCGALGVAISAAILHVAASEVHAVHLSLWFEAVCAGAIAVLAAFAGNHAASTTRS
jgi:MFS family permease